MAAGPFFCSRSQPERRRLVAYQLSQRNLHADPRGSPSTPTRYASSAWKPTLGDRSSRPPIMINIPRVGNRLRLSVRDHQRLAHPDVVENFTASATSTVLALSRPCANCFTFQPNTVYRFEVTAPYIQRRLAYGVATLL